MDNQQFGPPLRFKAVDMATGKVYAQSEPIENPMGSHSGFAPEDAKNYFSGANRRGIYTMDGGLYFEFQGLSEDEIPNLLICQSTDFTDREGVEIYVGSVLAFMFPDFDHRLFEIAYRSGSFWAIDFETNEEYCPLLDLEASDSYRAVGNRWQPIEVLKKRAKELANV